MLCRALARVVSRVPASRRSRPRARLLRFLPLVFPLASLVLAPVSFLTSARAQTPAADTAAHDPDSARFVDVIRIDGTITPITTEQIEQQIRRSQRAGRAALVLLLDTPGGLEPAMRSIVRAILASDVPIFTYVSPEGARAASAGLFLVTASHVAAMAPNTNLGAASPVSLGGPVDSTLKSKATNDAAAFIATLARQRGRNIDWNVRAVREAVAVPADSALLLHVVDLVVPSVEELLRQADGRRVHVASGERTLRVAGARLVRIEPSFRHRILSFLADPTVAYILFNLGSLGLVFELSNPGAILPGVVGAICLVLALVAFQILPVNIAGVLLLLLAMGFFLIELKVQSHGILAAGGVLAFLGGSLILFNPASGPVFQVSLGVIASTTFAVTAFFLFAVGKGLRAQRQRPASGAEGLSGERGTTLSACAPGSPGQIYVHGEIWSAEPMPGTRSLAAGEPVEVVALRGLTALVKPAATPTTEGSPR